MATATKRTKVKEKVVKETVNDGATLTLSRDEAETLSTVLANVGGNPWYSRRKHTESILNALDSAGVIRTYSAVLGLKGVLEFKETGNLASVTVLDDYLKVR